MADTTRYALLVCLHCTEDAGGKPLVIPFGGDTEKDATAGMRRWWAGHEAATGHTWAWRNPEGTQPPPDEAARMALAYMAEMREYAPPRAEGAT